MEERRLAPAEEWVEPEILAPGGHKREEPFGAPPPRTGRPGLLQRLKAAAAGLLGLLAAGLFLAGAFLTSTVIGAIIGIPLMLAGALAFFLMFKLIASGSKSSVIFRRF